MTSVRAADEYAWAAPVYDPATAWALGPLRRELAALARLALRGDGCETGAGPPGTAGSAGWPGFAELPGSSGWTRTVKKALDMGLPPVLGGAGSPAYAGLADALCAVRALDVCCGTGRQCLAFEQAGVAAVGVDLSPAMLAKARLQARRTPFLRCDAARLPFADHSFQCCTIALALHEKPLATRQAIFADMLRVTRPGGLLLLVDYCAPPGPSRMGRRLLGLGVTAMERLAGREHHACYAQWMRGGGLEGFLSGMAARTGARTSMGRPEIRRRLFGLLGLAVVQM